MAGEILKESVYEALLARILSGSIQPGATLREAQLAQEFAVSRTPVREAIRQLADEGLVECLPHCGGKVVHITRELAREIFQVREALEGIAAREAANRMDRSVLSGLRRDFEVLRGRIAAGDLSDAGDEIHSRLFEAAGNRRLQRLADIYRNQVAWLQQVASAIPGRLEHAFREHDGVLTALESRDPEWAERAARAHVRNTMEEILAALPADSEVNGHRRRKRREVVSSTPCDAGVAK